MKNVYLLISLIFMLLGCSKTQDDLCEGVVCINGGVCINGDCSCPPGYTGPACEQEKTPVKIRITDISLTKFPATDANGAGWDVFDGPDIYIEIKKNGTSVYKSGFIEDLQGPHKYTNANVEFLDPSATYNISVLDYDDGLTADDFMGGINFTPYQSGQNFPVTYNIDCGNCVVAFTFHVAIYTH